MIIYEYQAKGLLQQNGVTIPRGKVASSADDALSAAKEIGGKGWVIKSQILAGGRGKAGGIKITGSLDEVKSFAENILSSEMKTYQSGNSVLKVKQVLVEERCDIAKEYYLAFAIDRSNKSVICIASSEGGVEIEETAKKNPSAIHKENINPLTGLMGYNARNIAYKLGFTEKETQKAAIKLINQLYSVFIKYDCSLLEINPLVLTKQNTIIPLDAKFNFDDSGLDKHPEIAEMRDLSEEQPSERIARESGLNYIQLEGNIGCMVNGAGLAMATMDTLKFYGGDPANFLDVGGGASSEMVTNAFNILMSNAKIKVIFVNIFGGILKCDLLAEGIVTACKEVKPNVPIVVRLDGTNVERGRQILSESGLDIITAENMKTAAQKAVQLAGK